MRSRSALLAAALLAAQGCGPAAKAPPPPAESRPTAAEDGAILRPLLAFFAQSAAPNHGLTCVGAETRAWQDDPFPEALSAGPNAQWVSIPYSPGALPPELRQRLGAAAARAQRDPNRLRIVRLDQAWVPAPLRSAPPATGCETAIAVSAPWVQGDIALVLTASACGPECGSGGLYALRRESGGWRPFAWLGLWIA
jgi:hypothetical protein